MNNNKNNNDQGQFFTVLLTGGRIWFPIVYDGYKYFYVCNDDLNIRFKT